MHPKMWPRDKTMGHPFVTLREWGNGKKSNASVSFLYTNTCGTNRRKGRSVQSQGFDLTAVTERGGGTAPVAGMLSQMATHCWGGMDQEHTELDLPFTRGSSTWSVLSSVSGWVTGEVRGYGSGPKSWLGRVTLEWVFAPGCLSRRRREWELLQVPRNSLTVTPCFLWGDITNLTSTREAQTMQEIPGKHWWWLPVTSGEGSHKEQCTPWLHINSEGLFGAVNMGGILGCSDHEVVGISIGWGGKRGERL